jgi:hypothetical protein
LNSRRWLGIWDDRRDLLNTWRCGGIRDDWRALLNIRRWLGFRDGRRVLLNIWRCGGFWDDWQVLLSIYRCGGIWDGRQVLLSICRRLGGRRSRDPSKKRGGRERYGDGSLHGWGHFEDGLLSGGPALRYAEPVPRVWRRVFYGNPREFLRETAAGARLVLSFALQVQMRISATCT